MAAELRQDAHAIFVVCLDCGIEEDWDEDETGATVRVDEHNEAVHPAVAAGTLEPIE